VDNDGNIHLLYVCNAGSSGVFYMRSEREADGLEWSEPVDISDVKSALVHPDKIEHKRPADGEPSDVYRGSHCWVSVNPNSAMLIQTSPKKKGGF